MKKLFTTLSNIWKIQELKERILFTLLILLVYRFVSHVVLPGVDPTALGNNEKSGILGLLDMFAGGSFSRVSILALGVMPYISASIVVQLLGIAVPSFQKMQKEGESGRKKMNQITRYLTVAITIVQSVGYVKTQVPAEAILLPNTLFLVLSTFVLTAVITVPVTFQTMLLLTIKSPQIIRVPATLNVVPLFVVKFFGFPEAPKVRLPPL